MNVFLMYPARDFTPEQKLPSHAAALIQDLELNILFEAMAQGDKYLYEVANQVVLSILDEPNTIRYRQEILQDCLRNPEVVRQIYQIPIQAIETKQKLWMGIFTRSPSGILSSARAMLEMYVAFLRLLKQIADEHGGEFKSAGFRRFLTMIQSELDDDYFAVVTGHLEALKFRKGVTISAELGYGNEGANYILRKPNPDKQNLIERITGPKAAVYSFTLHPKDDHGASALADLMDRGLNLVANAVAQSSDHINSFFNLLRQELAFYIGCLNVSEQLRGLGEPITIPEPAPANQDRLSFKGLYDICLALTLKQKVVGNELQADDKNLVIITGANQGGKSTFLRSIGLAQLMTQCGMFVPAEYFSANVCKWIFTHYKREEDSSMTRGKFDEELSRMSDIIDRITPHSMVLFNESFAATNDREGSQIARQITSALLDKKIKVIFVTHLYELAHGYYEDKFDSALFLRAERKASGERTFRIIAGEPMQTSFGMDVYQEIFDGESRES
jgi:DNA mismatch repair ATPase MutS